MSLKIVRLSSLLFAFVLAASAFCFDSSGLAITANSQNANSSTTVENSNTGATSSRKGRRHKDRVATGTPETTATSASETMPTASTEQTDLSGTYMGTFDCSDAGVNGDTTLTITGNQFTLADGKTGRIVASTTQGYTSVAMQFGEMTAATVQHPATPPMIISMRAKKSGERLTLMTVSGATHVCSFTPSRAASGRRTHRKAMAAEPATPATPAEPTVTPATPAEPATPPDTAGPTPPATPTPRPRGRRGRRGNTNTNTNSSAQPSPTPSN